MLAGRNNADLRLLAQSDESDNTFRAELCCNAKRLIRTFGVMQQRFDDWSSRFVRAR